MITQVILEMLDDQSGKIEIQRNELANKLGCVPSQINYVITSRFTPEQGYIVESKRGGGGYIRISRANLSKNSLIMHIVNSIGDRIGYLSIRAMLNNLVYENILDEYTGILILCAVSDSSLKDVDLNNRDIVRASILKQLLLTLRN